jgi:hypothetical protein
LVEISSDEEAPRLYGPLRGLNSANILQPAITTKDADDGPHPEKPPARHSTRVSGDASFSRTLNYSTKFHPMDVVTRPNSAGARRLQSQSKSMSSDDEEEDNTSSSTSSHSSQDSEEDSSGSEVEAFPSAGTSRAILAPRVPDPKAVRSSSRTEAQKPVLYSSKHHPQDYGLPGRRRKAYIVKDDGLPRKRNRPSFSPDASKSKAGKKARPSPPNLSALLAGAGLDINDIVKLVSQRLRPNHPVEDMQHLDHEDTLDANDVSRHTDTESSETLCSSPKYSLASREREDVVATNMVPMFIQDRLALTGAALSSITYGMILETVLADHTCSSVDMRLVIHRPYHDQAVVLSQDYAPTRFFEDQVPDWETFKSKDAVPREVSPISASRQLLDATASQKIASSDPIHGFSLASD